ncbi:MAG: FtsX-like permease family protein [Ruminococcus sp.]|jgi:putative ABC transport system permease protein
MKRTGEKLNLHMRFLRTNKRNTAAIFLSFVLILLLMTVMLILIHTNFRISSVQLKREFTPSDCYIDDLNIRQINLLKEDPEIAWMGRQQGERCLYRKNHQDVYVSRCDEKAITMMTRLSEGRLPLREGEAAAERWVLLNLGIEPEVGQVISLTSADTGEKREIYLTGILEDIYGNKKYGLLELYGACRKDSEEKSLVYLEFEEGVNYREKIKELEEQLGISKEQIRECPARENFLKLYLLDARIIALLLLLGLVVFYGIYRISAMARREQYGILRAVGMKKGQLLRMMFLEVLKIYLAAVPAGVLAGIFLADLVVKISGDKEAEMYLHNAAVRFQLVIPVWQIAVSIILTGLLAFGAVWLTGRGILRASVTGIIMGSKREKKSLKSGGRLREKFRKSSGVDRADTKLGLLFRMGCKYMTRDLRSSGMVVLVLCSGIVLFTGLCYQAEIQRIYREDTREMYYLNGQYAVTMQYFDQTEQGVSREDAGKLQELEEIDSVKTSSSLPVRVIDEDCIERNEEYYDHHNENMEKIYGYSDAGFDGKDQIYKSILSGYNREALEALLPYVTEGEFDPYHMKEDEVILSVLRTEKEGGGQIPGAYKDGVMLMEYHAGDEIRIKYRKNLQTNLPEYENLSDMNVKYQYRTYKIAAIVSFPYMYDCSRTLYPVLITSDRQMQAIAPQSGIQCMYLEGKKDLTDSQQIALERKLIRIASQNPSVSTRSLAEEIRQNEMIYNKQMVYISGIAVISLILVLICMINQLSYRMRSRTKEICMLRALGMGVAMVKQMFLLENLILGCLAALAAFWLAHPALGYLYEISQMKVFGHRFTFACGAFGAACGGALIICVLLSLLTQKVWKSRKMAEEIKTDS